MNPNQIPQGTLKDLRYTLNQFTATSKGWKKSLILLSDYCFHKQCDLIYFYSDQAELIELCEWMVFGDLCQLTIKSLTKTRFLKVIEVH